MLSSFLSEIKSSEMNDVNMNTMVPLVETPDLQINILLSLVHSNDPFIRLTTVTWIYEFLLLDSEWTVPYARLVRILIALYADHEKEVADKAKACCRELVRSVRVQPASDS